jgi:hypothetical protein
MVLCERKLFARKYLATDFTDETQMVPREEGEEINREPSGRCERHSESP